MDEFLIGLVFFSLFGVILGGSILGIVTFFLNRALKRRVLELEERGVAPRDPAAEAEPESPAPEPAVEEEVVPAEPSAAVQKIEAPAPAKKSASAKPARKRIEWEKLLGIRGAAILGGLALVIAAIFFFQHAIQEGWFDQRSRVVTGAITGTLLLIIQGRLRAKGYTVVSDVLAGSGAVVHYAAAWAAFRLYHIISLPVGFGWMALVTAVCCWLAVRHSAQLIAIFGLVGGFATPLLLATTDGAIGLFGYILLLDFALLAIGRRQDWPWLGLLGLFGTTGSQILWLVGGHEEEAAVGLIACGLFGLLFVFMGGPKSSPLRTRWQLGRIAGVLIPFAIAIHYAHLVELGDDYLVIACVATLLAGAATFVGRRLELPALPLASAAAAAGVASTWLLSRVPDEGSLIYFALLTGATSLILAVLDSWPRRADSTNIHPAAVHSLVLLFVLAYFVIDAKDLSLWGICSVIGIHLGLAVWARAALPALPVLAGLAAGVSFLAYRIQHVHPANAAYHNVPMLLIAVILASGALLIAAVLWRRHPAPRALALAAVLCALPSLAYFRTWFGAEIPLYYGALALIALISACGAARVANSFAYAPVVLLSSWALYRGAEPYFFESREWAISEVLPWFFLCVATTTLAPLLSRKSLTKTRFLGFMAAATPILGIGRFLELHGAYFGERGALLVLVALALLPALGYLILRDDTTEGEGARRAKTAYLMSACFLLGFAIPAELRKVTVPMGGIGGDDCWALVGLSLAGALMSMAARRRSSSAWSAVSLAAAVIPAIIWSALLLDPDDYLRENSLVLNWMSYHYGLSLLSLLFVLHNASAHGVADFLHRALRVCGGGLTCLLGFAFINLLLINGYSEGERLDSWSSADLNRDLVLSLAWALYSFSLLALGTRSGVAALRWASLAFLLATIVKVFLVDLGNLEGLQRVGSFLGLAVCLILVSLFYQRFVFRKEDEEPEPSA